MKPFSNPCRFALPMALAATTLMLPSSPGCAAEPAPAWAQVPAILARIVPPTFPDREFNITSFGAVGDGTNDCTQAFANAIAACNAAGGGRVLVPPGNFLSGAIHLKSKVNLHLARGATIKFSTDPKKFLPLVVSRDVAEMMNYSPFVYAFEQHDIAITGEGTLDGQASKGVWPSWVGKERSGKSGEALQAMGDQELPLAQRIMGEGHFIRPNFVQPFRCRNVLIEGITITDSPMWVLHPVYSTNVTIRGVTVISHGKNNDGCDPDSCKDVLIKDCTFDTGDDCIAVKAGRDHDGRRVNIPTEDVVIQNCRFKDGHGGVTMGSETSGGIRNVFAEDCHFDSPNLDQALRFKSNRARGGFIRDIYIRNCTIKTAKFGIHMTLKYTSSGLKEGEFPPVVRDLDIRDCVFENVLKQAVFIEGVAGTPITDVTIANCTFPALKTPNTITNTARIHLLDNKTASAK